MEVINDYVSRIDDLRRTGYPVKIEQYLRKGVRIFQEKPEYFLLYTALFLAAMPLGGFLFAGPLGAGFFIAAHRLEGGKPIQIDHFFDGFRNFIPLFLVIWVRKLLR